jgi:hypothetical protein
MVELLGIIQSVQPESLGQDYCRGYDGTGQRSPSRLIDPSDRSNPSGIKFLFVEKRRASGCPEALLGSLVTLPATFVRHREDEK